MEKIIVQLMAGTLVLAALGSGLSSLAWDDSIPNNNVASVVNDKITNSEESNEYLMDLMELAWLLPIFDESEDDDQIIPDGDQSESSNPVIPSLSDCGEESEELSKPADNNPTCDKRNWRTSFFDLM